MNNNIDELLDIVCDILYDMGKEHTSMCLYSKAKLRLAFEPFISNFDDQNYLKNHIMSLEDANNIVNEIDNV